MKEVSEQKQDYKSGEKLPLVRLHMPELDAIRGLAILGVIFYHGFYWKRNLNLYGFWQQIFLKTMAVGQYGVDLFFILSGFLITGILLNTRERTDYYKRFYLRRALRILPAYYLTLAILVLFKLTSTGFLWMSLLYSSNLAPLFGFTMSYAVLWSLAVEEHFYFVWPAAVRKLSSKGLMVLALSLMVLSPVLRFCCAFVPVKYWEMLGGCAYYTWNCADGLALGAVIAIVIRGMNNDRRRLLRFSLSLIAIGFLIAATGYPLGITTRLNPIGAALQSVPWHFGLGGLLGIFVVVGSGKWKSIVAPRILTFVGTISYGLYLYHLLFSYAYRWLERRLGFEERLHLDLWQRTWVPVAIASAAAIMFSYVSRWYFEEPFLRLKERWERPTVSPEESKMGAAGGPASALKS